MKEFPCGSIQRAFGSAPTPVQSVLKNSMSLISLKYVLLFALAYSQIFGGISCCCLGRTLFSIPAVVDASSVGDETSKNKAAETASPTGKCPKCSARKSTERLTSKDASTNRETPCSTISDDGQCRCQKLVINSSTPNEPSTVDNANHTWWLPVLGSAPKHEVAMPELRKFEVPIRFGGRSWQSIACVWKN